MTTQRKGGGMRGRCALCNCRFMIGRPQCRHEVAPGAWITICKSCEEVTEIGYGK